MRRSDKRLLLLVAVLTGCECEGAALRFFSFAWYLLAALGVRGSEYGFLMLGAGLLVFECGGAALSFFCC